MLEDGGGQDLASFTTCGQDDPPLSAGEPQGVQNLFAQGADGSYRLLSAMPVAGSPQDVVACAWAPDLSHVVFASDAQLTPDAPPDGTKLYDWSAGTVQLVTQLTSGVDGATHGCFDINPNNVIGGMSLGNVEHAVSADGSKIFFNESPGCTNGCVSNLYVREKDATTVQLDTPAPGAPGPGGNGRFAWASADGSVAYFSAPDTSGLTADTVPGG
jgi:hypothetical protein